MAYYIGVDCGTQGTKVVVYDGAGKVFAGEGYRTHEIFSGAGGAREQEPAWWIDALDFAMGEALKNLSPSERKKVAGIGVSGQQHGLVILDKDKKVLRRAKLWNDTETAGANRRYIAAAGGPAALVKAAGTAVPVGYTASKLVWLRENENAVFGKIAYVLNPKDYINFYLSGVIATDAGSASGTGYFDVINRRWSDRLVSLISDGTTDLGRCLPPVIGDTEAAGKIRPEIAAKFGLAGDCVVAAGSGDNMMAACGTGNVREGAATMTLGTSGVLSVFTGTPPAGCPEIVQIQNTLPSGWLPTICIMNATSATTAVQRLFGLDLKTFDAELAAASAGAGGIIMFPFFSGERMPALESESGAVTGLTAQNFSRANLIRACAESVAFALRWGRGLLRERGADFRELRLVGGGSNSAPWRQIIADVFNTGVTGVKGREAGAFGGIIQAMCACGEGDIPSLCEAHIRLDDEKRALPDRDAAAEYDGIYEKYLALRNKLYGV